MQHYIHFTTELTLEPKYASYTRLSFSDHWVDSHDESKSFKIIFPCRNVRSYIGLFVWCTLGNSFPVANLPSIESACHQFCLTLCIKFQLQSLMWFWKESTHKWVGIYNPFQNFLFIFSVIHCWIFQYCIRPPRSILLSVIWYDRGEHRLIVNLSAF